MWGFEASALAFIQLSVPASFCVRIDCRGQGLRGGWSAATFTPVSVRIAVGPLSILVNLVAAIVMAGGRTVGLESAVVAEAGV